ncbi:MAG: hypothetical protein K0M45_09025 [Candidatus Paracaedibacteraceae bacterium]|nr:hypothetical protein [Candidatus Paracaedibacteraceae bacterium]
MDKKNLFTFLLGTAIAFSLGIPEANARFFRCLSSTDSTVTTPNPLLAFQGLAEDKFNHEYQLLGEEKEELSKNFSNNAETQLKGKLRNFVYKLKGKKTFYLFPSLDISGVSNTSLATTGDSQFSDLPDDPDEIISSSYNVDLSEKQYKGFVKYIIQTNNSFLPLQGSIINTLLSCSPQSEE